MRMFLGGVQVQPSQKVCVQLVQQTRNAMFEAGALGHLAPCTKFFPVSLPTDVVHGKASILAWKGHNLAGCWYHHSQNCVGLFRDLFIKFDSH